MIQQLVQVVLLTLTAPLTGLRVEQAQVLMAFTSVAASLTATARWATYVRAQSVSKDAGKWLQMMEAQ